LISVGVACALRLQLKKLFPTDHGPPTQVSMATPRKLSKIKADYYSYSPKELPIIMDDYLRQLPGGETWIYRLGH
jgi:hypothetical protein